MTNDASPVPSDVIPAGCEPVIEVDYAKDGADCTVRGFFDPETGEFHVQDVSYSA